MNFLQNLPIRFKVLLAPILLVIGLLILALLGVYGLEQQNATLDIIREDIFVRIRAIDDFTLLSEQVQSDVFQISILQSMALPVESILPIQARLETRLNDLNIRYGQMLINWDLDETEKELLIQIKEPLEIFRLQAEQAARVVISDPALGVLLVRSSTVSFGELGAALDDLRVYEEMKITQADQSARQRAQTITHWITIVTLSITLTGIGATSIVSAHLITRPIQAMTNRMTRLAGGDLDIDAPQKNRQDEIGAMARAVEVFRTNAIAKNKAEQALLENQRRLNALMSNLLGMAYRGKNDMDWTMEFVSDGCYTLTGYKSEELVDNARVSYAEVIHPEDRQMVWDTIQAALDDRQNYQVVYRISTANKEEKWVWKKGGGVFSDTGDLIALEGFITDISERMQAEEEKRQLEAHLRKQQKLESLGTLASGVAHEINNPIFGIMNYARLISERLDPTQNQLREFADGIGQETERVAAIVRNLLAFARQDKQSHSPARITDIVNDTLLLIRTVIRRDQITLEVDLPDKLPKIKCRSQQIQQVLMNLLTNARDALNERYPEHDPDKIITLTVRPFEKEGRPWLRTTVEDHGAGIPAAISERVFDPFYTTKDRSRGTGLGLSISRGIVQEHHGELSFESVENQFTRFYLDLPVDNGWELGTGNGKQ